MFQLGVAILNYLDDMAGVESKMKADFAYRCLENVLSKCGLEESKDKASPPSEIMTFLGVLFNSRTMTIEVTLDRLIEIKHLISVWKQKESASLKQLQSLIGKLNFVAACVRPGRIFISRLLNWLREISLEYVDRPKVEVVIPQLIKKDIEWWDRF